MIKKFTLLSLIFCVCFSLEAQINAGNEPCTAPVLAINTNCSLIDTNEAVTFPPTFTNSTSASSGVTLPALTCNGFNATTLDFWYRCVVPTSGKVIITTDAGNDPVVTNSVFWDMAVYSASSSTCAGSTFTELGKECLAANLPDESNAPLIRLSGLTPGSTIYIRMWRQAASTQAVARGYLIYLLDGGIAQPPTCATPVAPISPTIALKDDPYLVWNNDAKTQSYDLYYGTSSTIASMNVTQGLEVSDPYEAQEAFTLPHAFLNASGIPVNIVAPNATNYWFVHQKNCATDPDFVPTCTPSSYKAAPIPANDNCSGAVAFTELGIAKTFSSASSTESKAAVTCLGFASSTASDVWFTFKTTAAGGSVTATISPSGALDAVVEAFSGTCGSLTSLSCADATSLGGDEVLTLTGLTPNTTYYIRVFNYDANDLFYGEEFDVTLTGNVVIPVELVDFTAKTQGAKNALNWQTTSERNAQSFTVERSADGEKGFTAIGTIKAAGTTSTPQSYAFLDENPLPVSYYRLRQMDLDGKSAVSKIVTVQRKDKRLSLEKAFPMPATNELTVQYSAERSGALSLQLVDVLGRRVLTQNITATEGGNVVKMPLDNVATGAYVLMLSDGLKVSQMRIVKQ